MTPLSESAVDELAAKLEIHEVLARYCRGVDRCDAALIESAYHPDAVDHHGAITASGADIGRILAKKLKEHYTATQHQVTNTLVSVHADHAASESYYVARHLFTDSEGATQLLEGSGRYLDRFERRGGAWRISARTVVTDWAVTRPAPDPRSGFVSPPSLRSPDDLSYANFDLSS